jgi:hypothetical protein
MMAEKMRRRPCFHAGTWIRMGDGQEWMFPHPPTLGSDREYDALWRCLLESENAAEARRNELALAILLLSRNYDPQPKEYETIFDFGTDPAVQSSAQTAISKLIYHDLANEQFASSPKHDVPAGVAGVLGTLQSLVSSCASRVRSRMAVRHQ